MQDEFFSQFGEDRWIRQSLALPRQGVYCEVGAHDGRTLSNTAHFHLCGWTGVLVEPDPRNAEALYLNRPDDFIFTVVAGKEPGFVSFRLCDDSSLSGVLRDEGRSIRVQCKTLTQILREAGVPRLDLLSIDTEGTELDVWAGLDLTYFRPQVVIIEFDTIGLPDRSEDILRTLESDGYGLCHQTGANLIFTTGS
jgi:FkbM family methyltransferase